MIVGQNTKYALAMFSEHVHIYALFGRTKWTQNLRWEDQNRYKGPGVGPPPTVLLVVDFQDRGPPAQTCSIDWLDGRFPKE